MTMPERGYSGGEATAATLRRRSADGPAGGWLFNSGNETSGAEQTAGKKLLHSEIGSPLNITPKHSIRCPELQQSGSGVAEVKTEGRHDGSKAMTTPQRDCFTVIVFLVLGSTQLLGYSVVVYSLQHLNSVLASHQLATALLAVYSFVVLVTLAGALLFLDCATRLVLYSGLSNLCLGPLVFCVALQFARGIWLPVLLVVASGLIGAGSSFTMLFSMATASNMPSGNYNNAVCNGLGCSGLLAYLVWAITTLVLLRCKCEARKAAITGWLLVGCCVVLCTASAWLFEILMRSETGSQLRLRLELNRLSQSVGHSAEQDDVAVPDTLTELRETTEVTAANTPVTSVARQSPCAATTPCAATRPRITSMRSEAAVTHQASPDSEYVSAQGKLTAEPVVLRSTSPTSVSVNHAGKAPSAATLLLPDSAPAARDTKLVRVRFLNWNIVRIGWLLSLCGLIASMTTSSIYPSIGPIAWVQRLSSIEAQIRLLIYFGWFQLWDSLGRYSVILLPKWFALHTRGIATVTLARLIVVPFFVFVPVFPHHGFFQNFFLQMILLTVVAATNGWGSTACMQHLPELVSRPSDKSKIVSLGLLLGFTGLTVGYWISSGIVGPLLTGERCHFDPDFPGC